MDASSLVLTPQFEPYRGLIEFLFEDLKGLAQHANEDTEAQRRNKIKTTFSCIEGFVNLAKQFLLDNFAQRYTPKEVSALQETNVQINEKGDLHDRDYYPRVNENLLFTFKMIQKGVSEPHELDHKSPTWKRFLEFVKLRHKLVHPKVSAHSNVSAVNTDDFGRTILWLIDNFVSVLCAAKGKYTVSSRLLRVFWICVMYIIIVATKAPAIVAAQKLKMENDPLFKKSLKFFRKCQKTIFQAMGEIKHFSTERPDLASVVEELIELLTKMVTAIIPSEVTWDVN